MVRKTLNKFGLTDMEFVGNERLETAGIVIGTLIYACLLYYAKTIFEPHQLIPICALTILYILCMWRLIK